MWDVGDQTSSGYASPGPLRVTIGYCELLTVTIGYRKGVTDEAHVSGPETPDRSGLVELGPDWSGFQVEDPE
jgi:hypothetical protein